MRILSNLNDSTARGIISVCEVVEDLELVIFDNSVSVFDVFDEVKPHLYITKNNLLNRAILKYLLLEPNIKTCIIQTKERNFYGRELENKGRLDYTIPDAPAADLITFGGLPKQDFICGDYDIVIGDLVDEKTFDYVKENLENYKVFGNKFIEHPSYVGTIDYKDLVDVYSEPYSVLCTEETDQEYNLIQTNKVSRQRGRDNPPPTAEEIIKTLNYSVKLADILKNTGFEKEAELCLATLKDL